MIALVTGVRDEVDRIGAFLDHHRRIGVERAYVYLDRCRDGTAEVVADRADAVAIGWDRDPAHRWYSEHQNVIVVDALERAAADGVEWLLHLDVDEYAWAGPVGELSLDAGHLEGPLQRAITDIVRFTTVEAVPQALGDGTPPWALEYVQPGGRFRRAVLDPRDGSILEVTRLGHPRGKTAVRVGSALVPEDSHAWRRPDGSVPDEEVVGHHLHALVTDPTQWQAKYRKIACPDHWPNGCAVPFPKQAWKEAALAMSPAEARAYFDRWVAASDDDLRRGLAEGSVVHWPLLRSTLGLAPAGGARV